MRVVVDIPNWLYNAIMECEEPEYSKSLGYAVRDGITLPKGHGRLIDAKRAEERLRQALDEHEGCNSLARYIVSDPIETPTIIGEEGEDE